MAWAMGAQFTAIFADSLTANRDIDALFGSRLNLLAGPLPVLDQWGLLYLATTLQRYLVQMGSAVCPNGDGRRPYITAELFSVMMGDRARGANNLNLAQFTVIFQAAMLAKHGAGWDPDADVLCPISPLVHINDWASFLNVAPAGGNVRPRTLIEMLEVLNLIAALQPIRLRLTRAAKDAVALFICSMAKQGTATASWIRSRMRQISDELGADIDLDRDELRIFWEKFGRLAQPYLAGEWGGMFAHLYNGALVTSTRLAVTAEQSSRRGFSMVDIISSAIARFPTFPWATVYTVAELGMQAAAYTQLEADNYFGFPVLAGAARAATNRQLSGLGYGAIRLMIEVGGVVSIREYAGPIQSGHTVREKMRIDNAVDWFKAHYVANALPVWAPAVAAPLPGVGAIYADHTI